MDTLMRISLVSRDQASTSLKAFRHHPDAVGSFNRLHQVTMDTLIADFSSFADQASTVGKNQPPDIPQLVSKAFRHHPDAVGSFNRLHQVTMDSLIRISLVSPIKPRQWARINVRHSQLVSQAYRNHPGRRRHLQQRGTSSGERCCTSSLPHSRKRLRRLQSWLPSPPRHLSSVVAVARTQRVSKFQTRMSRLMLMRRRLRGWHPPDWGQEDDGLHNSQFMCDTRPALAKELSC
uniref:Uncharacterized protein n=1 Tax=Macrostomum lignano TaxID=282301 RepID=A0A1I8FJI1_9PLAT